ncbi:MAG: metallophosphoesterase [Candidatus Aenigmarchaeota archaeon]|nr:metallophosphoesterase [Candidatus Aenigmarchaeota archaeon]
MEKVIVFATDLHGEIYQYEKVFEVAAGKNVKALVIGGDIGPFLSVIGDIAGYQKDFISSYLIPRLKDFQKKTPKDVFLMMGNDDLKMNMEALEKGEKEGTFKIINQKVYPLGGKYIAGYSFVNEAPILIKDWEKSESLIEDDLERLSDKSDPRKTIYSMHAPPIGTNLDIIFSGDHVGSRAVREFIEKKQPYLTLHGHIHESPRMSGSWKDIIGETISVNPGKGSILVFGLNDLNIMEVMTV